MSLKERIPVDGRWPSDKESERHNGKTGEAASGQGRGTEAMACTVSRSLERRQMCWLHTRHFECFEDRKASPVCIMEGVQEVHVSCFGPS